MPKDHKTRDVMPIFCIKKFFQEPFIVKKYRKIRKNHNGQFLYDFSTILSGDFLFSLQQHTRLKWKISAPNSQWTYFHFMTTVSYLNILT